MGRSSEEKRCQQAGLVNLNIPHLKILRWGILISRYINIAHPGYITFSSTYAIIMHSCSFKQMWMENCWVLDVDRLEDSKSF